jgi:GNAT superfamily N-acetyltransferase
MTADEPAPADPIIRHPRAGDNGAIAALLAELGYPASANDVLKRLAELNQYGNAVTIVAASGETPVGLATAYVVPVLHHDRPVAVLSALVVSEAHRRGGVGRRLMEAAQAWARERKAYRITVSTGLARAGAHAFYESLGFEHTSRRYSLILSPSPSSPLSAPRAPGDIGGT